MEELALAVSLANRAAFEEYGDRDSCISTSYALAAFLTQRGYAPEPTRIETVVHPLATRHGCVLGWRGDGSRQPASGPGEWKGHLGVVVDEWLLDPTLDQADIPGVPHGAIVLITSRWLTGEDAAYLTTCPEISIRFRRFPRQNGWKSAAAARPIQWKPVLKRMHALANEGVLAS